MAGLLPLPENSKNHFNPDKPSRDQGKYYLKLLQFSTGRAFVFCCLGCMRKQRRHLELRMKMHFNDKAAHSFIPNFRTLNAISILPPLRRAPALVFLINTGVQKPARGSETRTVLEKWATFSLNMRQTEVVACLGRRGPFRSLADLSLPTAQAFRDPDLCIIHFAFGAQSTGSQICGQMDGHSYANSLVLVAKYTWKSHFPQLPLRHFKYSKPGKFFHFHWS